MPVWLAKGKPVAAFRSAIAGNEELENLVQGFQLSEEEWKEPEILLKHLKENFDSVTAWEGRITEQGRSLDYCANCEDQIVKDKFISGINKKRLMLKLLDEGHGDKATKEITPFKRVLQIAKNFEQCEKIKAVMQQSKGPNEQVNYAGARKPTKSEQNWGKGHFSQSKSEKEWGKGQSSHQGKFDICQYCAGPSHPRSICPASNKGCSRKGCGRIGNFSRACRVGAPPLINAFEVMNTKQQARHLDATLSEDCEGYGTDLNQGDLIPEKYTQIIFSTAVDQLGTRLGRKFFSH